jgi:hypothetical protein
LFPAAVRKLFIEEFVCEKGGVKPGEEGGGVVEGEG